MDAERYGSNCSIVYGYSSRFPVGSESASGLSLSDTVVLDLSVASEIQFKHCQEYQFIVTASNGSFTVRVMGIFGKFYVDIVRYCRSEI
ncbi:MAG: glycerol-3-phosphate dehydrogenase/oxidase, partial [Proteobacteria bacterium]|nr:glycerol-3-phosphate dehydrogenase/oxidase [Pseudomonadota bacterium]